MNRSTLLVFNCFIASVLLILSSSSGAMDRYNNLSAGLGTVPLAESSDSNLSGFDIQAGTDDKEASIKLGTPMDYGNLSVVFTAPLDQDTEESSFSNFDAFKQATSAKLNYQLIGFTNPKVFLKEFGSVTEAVDRLCEVYKEEFGSTQGFDDAACLDINEAIERLINEGKLSLDDSGSALNKWISIINAPIWLGGITAEYGTQEFEFFQATTLETSKRQENPWSMGAYVSRATPGKWMATLEYTHIEAYKPEDEAIRCSTVPADGTQFLGCTDAPGGPPEQSRTDQLSLTFRAPIPLSFMTVAIAPSATYDFEDDDTQLSLPIFLVQDSEGQFTAGIRAEWTDSEDDTEYSIFIGKRFSIL